MTSKALLALTASALALPGLAPPARGDTPPTFTTVGYRLSSYREDDLPAAALAGGARERYDITIHQFRLVTPVGENHGLTLSASQESMSGASPWYTIRRGDGSAGVVMSGATISERRRDLVVNAQRFLDNGSYTFTLGTSREDDYDSLSGGLSAERHFNNELTTVSAGFSYSSDDLSPTDAALFNRVSDAGKHSASLALSLSQVLSQTSLVQTALNVTRLSGYLTDPYKLADVRPDSRTQLAWSNAYRRFFVDLDAALHLDYRLFDDDFGINSHTLEVAWYQNFGNDFQLTPGLRYYTQSAADFYRTVNDFTLGDAAQSSDYRLASYGAISGSLSLQKTFDDLQLSLSAERYLTDAAWSLYQVEEENPALVDFTRLSVGIRYRF